MRAGGAVSLFAVAVLTGCVEKESVDPGAIVREETVNRVGPPSRATSRTVRCGCDADGGLHLSAPRGSRVLVPEDATQAAEAEVVLPDDGAPIPLRRTKSLGFIGDGKLTSSSSRGGPWNVPDALLPPHQHVEPRYGGYSSYGYRSYGYGPRVLPYVPTVERAFGPPSTGSWPSSASGSTGFAPSMPGPRSTPPGWR
jgi:hypothetical protein